MGRDGRTVVGAGRAVVVDRAAVVLQPPRSISHAQPGWLPRHLREQRRTPPKSLVCDVLTAEKTMMD